MEFLLDGQEFWFLEVNTRLQVEHPVTELVTGLDIVDWQLRVASGEPLDFRQEDVELKGHAIECRIVSEDPSTGFLPSTGVITRLETPTGPGVRWDGGVTEGFEVTPHYDPLLGKLIVHAPTRAAAISRMARALDALVLTGVETSAQFHRRVMDEPDFRSGSFSIRYLEQHPELVESADPGRALRAAAVAAALLEEEDRRLHRTSRIGGNKVNAISAWRAAGWPWRLERK